MTLPSKPLLTYYGDDLTGSTDAMEALTLKGLDVVLFVKRPSPEQLARFAASHVVGLAGTSRARSPQWMNQHLTEDFGWLRSCNLFGNPSPRAGRSLASCTETGLSRSRAAARARFQSMIIRTPLAAKHAALQTATGCRSGNATPRATWPARTRRTKNNAKAGLS